jgi:hypothetical protein
MTQKKMEQYKENNPDPNEVARIMREIEELKSKPSYTIERERARKSWRPSRPDAYSPRVARDPRSFLSR